MVGPTDWRPYPDCPAFPDLAALREAVTAGRLPSPEAVFAFLPTGTDPDAADIHHACEDTLHLVRDWLAHHAQDASRLVALTHSTTSDLLREPLHALVQVAAAENPGRLAVLDVDDHPATLTALPAALNTAEPRLVLTAGRISAPRLTSLPPAGDAADPAWDADGTVLITGGTGGLGSLIARHLVERHGIRHLVLTNRQGPHTPTAERLHAELTSLGAAVTITACDLTDPDSVHALTHSTRPGHPLTAVVHCAGHLDDALTANLTDRQLHSVLDPKVDAALNLHHQTQDLRLTHFVLFSSITAALPNPGQAHYAAANAHLTALTRHRAAQNQPAHALAWGLWNQPTGMSGHLSDAEKARIADGGMVPLDPEQGLRLFDVATARSDNPFTAVVRLEPAALRRRAAAGDLPAPLRELFRAPAERVASRRRNTAPLAGRLDRLTPAERTQAVQELLAAEVSAVLGHSGTTALEPTRGFKDLGFDSLTTVQLRNRLADATGLRLPATLLFDHPNPEALVDHLIERLLGAATGTSAAPAPRDGTPLTDDPIVVVGMACRYAGDVTSPDELWDLVAQGRDAITPFPTNRGWDLTTLHHPDPDHPGTTYTRHGGFLHTAGHFDADLFGISPREALAMDPQQRILLETAWEALENAGLDPTTQRGTRTGVFTGLMYHEYASRLPNLPDDLGGYFGTGNTGSIASGRLSYTFGFEGPAVTVDTACSSSLVAVHLAAQSLRSGESDLALAGGVTIMASPGTFIEFSRQRGLAPDGRCKPFAAAADGTGWAEGAGLLLLERLSDARRNHHTVLAVVRGTATNQDGASNGLTAPNGPSQQRVITTALTNAGLTTDDVDAVEAHGTGTTLGDPIEAQALQATYGTNRNTDQPLWLGSIKSNIGHTQAAAGAAGLIKMIQAMRHGQLPQTLHIDQPTPHIDWSDGTIQLLTEQRPWPDTGRPRRAAVSSFGISGTNAHVILEQGDTTPEPPEEEPNPVYWPLSGHTRGAVRDQARRLHAHLARHPAKNPSAVGRSLRARARFTERAAVTGTGREELLAGLEALAEGVPHPTVIEGTATDGKIVFVYPGQGSQWPGMATGLLDTHPAFTTAIDACAEALAPHTDWNLRHVLTSQDPELLQRTDIVQPALWAMMIALTRTWQHHGIHPHAVIGHSQGEITAAHIAGALTLHDSARIIALRSHTLHHHAPPGGMLSLNLNPNDTQHLIHPYDDLHIAAHNSPTTTIIAGNPHQLDTLQHHCTQHDIRHHRIPVTYASHTPHITTLRNQLLQQLAPINPTPPTIPFHSTLTTQPIDTTTPLNPDYWYQNLRHPVRFHTTLTNLTTTGHTHYLEPSPHPTLTTHITQTHPHTTTHHTLKRHQPTTTQLTHALAHTHTHGLTPTHPNTTNHHNTPPTPLPTYPFQHRNYWLNPDPTEPTSEDSSWTELEKADPRRLAGDLGLDPDALGAVLPALAAWRRSTRHLGSWRYRVDWRPLDVAEPADGSGATWAVVATAGVPTALTAAFEAAGAVVVPCEGPAELAALRKEHPGLSGVLSLLPEAADVVDLVNAHEAAGGAPVPLWQVTTNAVRVRHDEAAPSPEQAQIWGLGRVAALEHPTRWGGLVDLPAQPQPQHYALLTRHLTGQEDQLAVRDDGVRVPRLRRAPHPAGAREAWRPRGTVLVTGGMTGTGALVARWLARAGTPHLILTCPARGAGPDGAGTGGPLVAELRELGAGEVTVVPCDLTDRDAVRALLSGVPEGLPLSAVFHTAEADTWMPMAELTPETLAEGTSVRVTGARLLDELTRPVAPAENASGNAAANTSVDDAEADAEDDAGGYTSGLDAFVVFSSVAGVWGAAGQGAHAAAVASVDAVAQARRAAGEHATSIAWGLWAEAPIGVEDAAAEGERRLQLERRGLTGLTTEAALAALQQALDHDETNVVVADVDWARFAPLFTASRPSPMLAELPEVAEALAPGGESEDADGDGGGDGSAWSARLAGLPAEERRSAVLAVVRSAAAAVLGHEGAESVEASRPFKELGFDSLAAMSLRNQLNTTTGLRLPATLVFDHPTPTAVAELVLAELDAASAPGRAGERSAAGDGGRPAAGAAPELVGGPLTSASDPSYASDDLGPAEVASAVEGFTDDELFAFINDRLGTFEAPTTDHNTARGSA
ncbi:type I polyketide synthase [Streptomyces sp. WMMC1477]|uniref:type I polyketide synthase n=1 Tax=Streptomyces sp. WMMC1477 TaxID=3015155 RepID=UPI0022B68901|nr:type I polyketide synthase [Streptomyces sp. WMMC1477]MCZ7432817.1 type I polyketide synthase [Streptomyces sp. WMMC1477]